MKSIHIIITGGTIDAEPYEATPEHITPLQESVIPSVLEQLGLADHCHFTHMPHKDSKDYTEGDIAKLADDIATSPYPLTIITHGTDRMAEHARTLKATMANTHKMVLFTGAMTPIMNEVVAISKSDGPDNLAFACAQLGSLQPGVYIAFHKQLLDPDIIEKDFKNKCFNQRQD